MAGQLDINVNTVRRQHEIFPYVSLVRRLARFPARLGGMDVLSMNSAERQKTRLAMKFFERRIMKDGHKRATRCCQTGATASCR